MPWERRERVAERYRDGRVFVCGDAAHQLSPTGGLGLHTGLADSLDLAWKLTATLAGWGGETLLDSYEIERRPIALDNVHASTEAFETVANLPSGPAIGDDTAAGEAQRRVFVDALQSTPRISGSATATNRRRFVSATARSDRPSRASNSSRVPGRERALHTRGSA